MSDSSKSITLTAGNSTIDTINSGGITLTGTNINGGSITLTAGTYGSSVNSGSITINSGVYPGFYTYTEPKTHVIKNWFFHRWEFDRSLVPYAGSAYAYLDAHICKDCGCRGTDYKDVDGELVLPTCEEMIIKDIVE